MKGYVPPKGKITSVEWSIKYEGHSVLELLGDYPKETFGNVMLVIKNEGGFVDNNAIIHRGTATTKIVDLD